VSALLFSAVVVVVVVAAVVPAVAQAQDPKPAPPPRTEGTVDFSFVATTGNSDTQSIGVSADTIYRPESWEIRNKAAFVRAKTGEELSAQSLAYLFRAARKFSDRLFGYGQYDYARDRFAGIAHRNAVLAGVEYQLLASAPQDMKVFGGAGYVNEQRLTGEDVSTGALDVGWAYKLKVSETADVTDDLRWAESFYQASDWRLNHVAAVTAKISTLLSLKVSHTTRFVNFPPPGFDKTDTITAVALVAKF
jgi:putative salt-induced outer membrane protein